MKKYGVLLAGLFCMLMTGCASQKAWVYDSNDYDFQPKLTDKKIVVLPFKDKRDGENKNNILMYMIPLMPFGPMDMSAPEGSQMHVNTGLWTNYKPAEDYAKALAEELDGTGLFKESYFDYKAGDADYVIKGELLSTRYKGKLLTYGLSVYGPMLWFVGLPASTVTTELGVELSLVNATTDQVVFSRKYDATPIQKMSFLFKLHNDFTYAEMLKEVYWKFCNDLYEKI